MSNAASAPAEPTTADRFIAGLKRALTQPEAGPFGLLVLAGDTLCPVAVCRAADRPNFIWLISEDNSKHFMRLLDETGPKTPNIERLAEHGLVFDHAFSNAPVCSVARTTLVNQVMVLAYHLGIAPEVLDRWYHRSRYLGG